MGTLVNNLEIQPGKGSQYIRAAGNGFFPWLPGQVQRFIFRRYILSPPPPRREGTSGILLRKVNGTAIIQLPSKRQVQVRLCGGRLWVKVYLLL